MDKKFRSHLENVYETRGRKEIQNRIDRGDYANASLQDAIDFLAEQDEHKVNAYLLSPEVSALRQANAAEKAAAATVKAAENAQKSLWISGAALVVAVVALLAPFFTGK